MSELILQTRDLTRRYGHTLALDHAALSVEKGQIFGLVGRNGAGKTTIIRMVTAQTAPTEGELSLFGGTGEKALSRARSRTGAMVETPSFYPYLTAKQNLEYYRIQRGIPGKGAVDEVLEAVDLRDTGKKKFKTFSLGMKQRLGLAAALLGFPRLLILDEPTNGLDPAGIQEMRELICSLPERFGMTVVVSSHLLSEIDQMATHVGVIADGALVYQNTIERLHEKSEHHLAMRTLNNAMAQVILTHHGVANEVRDGVIILPPLEDAKIAQCVTLLADSSIGVTRIEERRKNLEDIFLELTEGAASL